jgi:hypothetical protein
MYASDFAAVAGLFIPPCSRLSSIQFSGQLGLQR